MKAPQDGRVTGVYFKAGEYVEAGAILFTIE
jgi:biotin carboxyl carrier protein